MLKGDLVFSILIFLGALLLFWVTLGFEEGTAMQGARVGPAFWPRVLLGVILLLSALVSVGTIRRINREKAWRESLLTLDRAKVRFFVALGLAVSYLLLLPILGFIIMTPLFMIAFMVLLGEKSKGWILSISVLMTAVVVVLFTKAMYVPLPRGGWLFREFSLLFY